MKTNTILTIVKWIFTLAVVFMLGYFSSKLTTTVTEAYIAMGLGAVYLMVEIVREGLGNIKDKPCK